MKLALRRVVVSTPGAENARRRWPQRESLLVRLTASDGHSGVGEASPLPGYSLDALSDVEAALAALGPDAIARAVSTTPPRAALAAAAALLPSQLPSARMALETATLDLLSRQRNLPAPTLLGAAADATRPLAQLLGPASAPDLTATFEAAVRAGFRHVKVKLGSPGQLERELEGVASLRRHGGTAIALRLDANGTLSAIELERALPRLAPLDLELFEEPGALPESSFGSLPLALDESLQGLDETEALQLSGVRKARYWVLKPMALGGLNHCWRLAEQAFAAGIVPIFSHCFDGPLAFRATAALALAWPSATAHGLAPHAGLAAWQTAPCPVQGGNLLNWTEPGLGTDMAEWFR